MTRSTRLRTLLLSVFSVAALSVSTATPAQAATGTLHYTLQGQGVEVTHVNPPAGCVNIQASYNLRNNTDQVISVYYSSSCQNRLSHVPSGGTWGGTFYSYRVNG
jgi:hypothetical protein